MTVWYDLSKDAIYLCHKVPWMTAWEFEFKGSYWWSYYPPELNGLTFFGRFDA